MDKKLKSITCFFFFIISYCAGQPAIQWQKSYGGSNDDFGTYISQTKDSGYVVAGYTISSNGNVTGNHGQYDYWILKLDVNGIIEWQKCYGGATVEMAYSVIQTKDGGYMATGTSESSDTNVLGNHGSYDYWIVKLDSAGELQWQKSYGGYGYDIAYTLIETRDGGYALAGSSESNNGDVTGHHQGTPGDLYPDYWIVKIDSVGNLQWQHSYGGTKSDVASSLVQTYDGGYIVIGDINSTDGDVTVNTTGGFHNWTIKVDSLGNLIWQKCFNFQSSTVFGTTGGVTNIKQLPDSTYIIIGTMWCTYFDDFVFARINRNGHLMSQRCYGGSSLDFGLSINSTTHKGYILAGYTDSNDIDVSGNHGSPDCWIVKLDSLKHIEWQNCFGGSNWDQANCVQQTFDGGYVFTGSSQSSNGNLTSNNGNSDFWIVKLAPYNVTGVSENEHSNSEITKISPNPNSGNFIINYTLPQNKSGTLEIFDVLGKRVYAQALPPWSVMQRVDVSVFPQGMYVCVVKSEGVSGGVKWVKE